jgi:hypothetical protein
MNNVRQRPGRPRGTSWPGGGGGGRENPHGGGEQCRGGGRAPRARARAVGRGRNEREGNDGAHGGTACQGYPQGRPAPAGGKGILDQECAGGVVVVV